MAIDSATNTESTMADPTIRTFTGSNRKVNAKGGLHYIRGNKAPYFSLTMESWVGGREDCFGAAHDELVKHWPELKPLADLHLSDNNGVPSYAVENGLYYIQHLIPGATGYGLTSTSFAKSSYGPDRTDDECTQIMADHFRISLNEARGLLVALIDVAETQVSFYERVYGKGSKAVVKTALAAWVEAQKPRWKVEADACIKSLGLVIFGDAWQAPEVVA